MTSESAGLLVYRQGPGGAEFLLVHPGGPYWRGRDLGAWSMPKGLRRPRESLRSAALREFEEETGLPPPRPAQRLGPVRTASGKRVHGWLAEADLDLAGFRSGACRIEWPPRTGRWTAIPEADDIRYFVAPDALARIHPSQRPILEAACDRIADAGRGH